MHLAITGICGKMGNSLLQIALQEKIFTKIYGIDIQQKKLPIPLFYKLDDIPEKIDVIIDFSSPTALTSILNYALAKNTAVVLATTGYSAKEQQQIDRASSKIPIFQTANFSVGISLLQLFVEKTAQCLGNQFNIDIIEKHHTKKKDSPSGTALILAKSLKNGLSNAKKNTVTNNKMQQRYAVEKKTAIGIHSIRSGNIIGEHEIIFAGNNEIITFSHSARSKEVFAYGALQAAIFIAKQPAGLYSMQQLLNATMYSK